MSKIRHIHGARIIRSQAFAALTTCVLFAGVSQAAAATICKPVLTFKEASFSEVQGQQRTWSASLDVDASRYAATEGSFEIKFLRLKEIGPDLVFGERFAWRSGLTHVSLAFWSDEAVLDYWLGDIAACPCADDRS
jgi:hypothetical protein